MSKFQNWNLSKMNLSSALKELKYHTPSLISRVCVATWNVAESCPKKSIKEWLFTGKYEFDIVCIGLQEIDMSPTAVLKNETEKKLIWQTILGSLYEEDYSRLYCAQMVGLFQILFIRKCHFDFVTNLRSDTVPVAIQGIVGTKGALGVRFNLYGSTFCFITLHLDAHQKNVEKRTQHFEQILHKMRFNSEDILPFTHDFLYIFGDLNYRLDNVTFEEALQLIHNRDLEKLTINDQLLKEKKESILLSSMREEEINFMPTYKFEKGTSVYNVKKTRIPSFCDRVLYRGNITCLHYNSFLDYKTSDHKPVSMASYVYVSESKKEVRKLSSDVNKATNPKDWKLTDFVISTCLYTGSHTTCNVATLNGKKFFMKTTKKNLVFDHLKNITNEIEILSQSDLDCHPRLYKVFVDSEKIYYVYSLCHEDLWSFLKKRVRFVESEARFLLANVVLILEELHNSKLIHRDLRCENLLFDQNGYLKVVDFKLSKHSKGRTYTRVGTTEYISPEMILNTGYNFSVDFWSLGILAYEIMCGYPPFRENDFKHLEEVLKAPVVFPHFVSPLARDLIEKLLTKNHVFRLGCLKGGITDIKNHSFFKYVDWEAMKNHVVPSFYTPQEEGKEAESKSIDPEQLKEAFKDFDAFVNKNF